MTPLEICQIALVVVGALIVLLWMTPGPCKCEKCSFHINERRVDRMRQEELAHDTAHKGFGFNSMSPDRFRCNDESCPRNFKRD